MANKKIKLLRPLDGLEIGSTMVVSQADATRLERRGAAEITGDAFEPQPEAQTRVDAAEAKARTDAKARAAATENKDLTSAPANKSAPRTATAKKS